MESLQSGFLHFIAQSDWIGKILFVILLFMSVTTWSLLILRIVSIYRIKKQDQRFLRSFQQMNVVDQLKEYLFSTNQISHLCKGAFVSVTAQTLAAHDQYRTLDVQQSHRIGEEQDFLNSFMHKNIHQCVTKASCGLTAFATIAATSPFIGLFGTVWGVYHALLSIGASGAASLDQVATPVGEALIMTGIGLAVAVPAVIAYNFLLRSTRSLNDRLEAYVFDLLPLLLTGQVLRSNLQNKTIGQREKNELV